MAIGVPEKDVYAAADAVLARGERPTVERVRLQLGRGSPARVGQLLEAWWEALAQRLAGESRLPDLPPEVATAFRGAWACAVEQGGAVVERRFDEARTALDAREIAMSDTLAEWERTIALARDGLAQAQRERDTLHDRYVDQQRLVDAQAGQITELNERCIATAAESARLTEELRVLTARLQAQESRTRGEVQAAEVYMRGVEARANREIDRAREELKASHRSIKDITRERDRERAQATAQANAAQRAVQKADQRAVAQTARADTLEAQFRRLEALPAAVLAAQRRNTPPRANPATKKKPRATPKRAPNVGRNT